MHQILNERGRRLFNTRTRLRRFSFLAAFAALLMWVFPVSADVTIGVIGDYGCGCFAESDVAALVKGWEPDFIMTVGDNNYSAGSAAFIDWAIGQYYHEFIHPYRGSYGSGAVSNRFFPSLGNHDMGTAGGTPYLDYFTLPGNERYYNYRYGPVEIFALNSEFPEPDGRTNGSVQAQWLQAQLAVSTAPWKLVYFHSPPFGSGANYGPTPAPYMNWPFAEWGASAVLSGHEHIYERLRTNNLVYFLNGLGGAGRYALADQPIAGSDVRFNQDYGAMRLVANDTRIVFEFVTRSNRVVDRFSIPPEPADLPVFTTYPRSWTVRPGTSVVFSVTTTSDQPPTYQWRYNGSALVGETNASMTLSNVQTNVQGSYDVVVSNSSGSARSSAARLVVLIVPTIVTQPLSRIVGRGSNATFSVVAEGLGALRYQWQRNGTDLPARTNSSLALTNLQLADSGNYRVVVSDDLGSTPSWSAALIVLLRPTITQPPIAQTVVEGGTAVLSVSVSPSTLPLTYRWFRNNLPFTNILLNAYSSFLVLPAVELSDNATYRVGITNLAGVSTPSFSSAVPLTVLADSDRDGLPNVWEEANQLRSDDPSDALADPDGDQTNNRQEYLAGTDPLDAASFLRIESLELNPDLTSVRLSFLARSNRTYAIERRGLSGTQTWSRLWDVVAASTNRLLEVTNTIGPNKVGQEMYRIATPLIP